MRCRAALGLLAVAVAACGEPYVDSTAPGEPTTVATGSAESLPSTSGPATTAPADGGVGLVVDGYTYTLETAGGCYRLEVRGEDMEPMVEERCPPPGFWYTLSGACAAADDGASPGDGSASETTRPCRRVIPTVLHGYLPPEIGHLCLPSSGEQPGEFGPVRFVARSESGLLLVALADRERWTTPFPYTADGLHWGEPPLDAPAWVIYAQCDAAGPWTGVPVELTLEMLVHIDPGAAREGQTLTIDPGTGAVGFDLSVFAPDSEGMLTLRLPAGAEEVRIDWSTESGPPTDLGSFRLPEEIIAEASSGWVCPDAPVLLLEVAPGDPLDLSLDWLTAAEAFARLGHPGVASDRAPGDPCPDTGQPASMRAPAEFGPVFEGAYRFEVSPEVLALGPEWMILSRGLHSGYGLDLGHLAASPGERYWGYLFPGTMLQIGIDRVEAVEPGSEGIEVLIPDIPEGLDGPYLLVVTVSGYSWDEGRPVLLPEHVAMHWEQDPG